MTRSLGSLGSGSSIPREGIPQTPMMEAARGGEPEPNDWNTLDQDWRHWFMRAHKAWAERYMPWLLDDPKGNTL